ncbi:MAG TPA: MraY family glycosyltransferase [Candidatus Limnocylindria bacterium]|nr:MraY family glycosyltransferase [Candidatus Limnocylindria bacterium]
MVTALVFVAAMVVSLVVTPIMRAVGHRYGLLDQPDERKIHEVPIPRLGGIAMALAFGVAIGLATLYNPDLGELGDVRPNRAPAIIAGVAILLVVGVWDDVRGMRPLVKLGFQILAVSVAWWLGLSIEKLVGPWGSIHVGALSWPLTVLWVVAVINAVNLIDGLDGLAAGVALSVLGAFAILAGREGYDPTLPVIAATAGAAIGFLAYNLHPATIIMGDTGSMFLGFVVAAIGISLTQDGVVPHPPWVPIVALGIPILDMIWAVVRRSASGSPIHVADRGHIHHQLLKRGLSQRDAMLLLTAVSAGFAVLAVLLGRM